MYLKLFAAFVKKLIFCYFSLQLKTLRLKILPNSSTDGFGQGGTRRMYLTILIALLQPLFMYWLTRHLPGTTDAK